ncbi:RNAse P Rpr2/Rpp21/SNM1 subunit domain-containing protein [Staphylotrichum tortipilum]|uniref:RNAse P Rpr2/Rpp21/SNM1 subunit domain-containing protein n=1 Tax=Staphylotrichum tortipilum TaxID=2831512 RepID=A0AAN6RQY4_9PEZI|nr:RNAse P Rpr2/Rpp21/SNM1 subunit domain-containing protein [Staphylotrichum longicolle]
MAKGKPGGGVQNRAIYSRISFLQQAAVALTSIPVPLPASGPNQGACIKNPGGDSSGTALEGMGRRLATDLRAVSLKTRIRLTPAVKQMICKFCDSVLIDGQSCTSTVENRSKGAKKPWADVLVRKCHTCGRERRYPVSAARPKRKTDRRQAEDNDNHIQEAQGQQG